MAGENENQDVSTTGERSFVAFLGEVFGAASQQATDAMVKLRSWMRADASVENLYASASRGELKGGFDDLFERVRNRVVYWNLRAVVAQVVMPIASGYLGYAAAVAAGLTGGIPVLVGFLVAAVIYLMLAPGTWRMLKEQIGRTIDDIFANAI